MVAEVIPASDSRCPNGSDVAELEVLSQEESAELQRQEARIRAGIEAFWEVGEALATIRDARLYRQTHSTFAEYCEQVWQMSDRHARRLKQAAETVARLASAGLERPRSESQVRALVVLEPEQQIEVWNRLTENGQPTAAQVAAAVATAQGKQTPATQTPAAAPDPWKVPANFELVASDGTRFEVEYVPKKQNSKGYAPYTLVFRGQPLPVLKRFFGWLSEKEQKAGCKHYEFGWGDTEGLDSPERLARRKVEAVLEEERKERKRRLKEKLSVGLKVRVRSNRYHEEIPENRWLIVSFTEIEAVLQPEGSTDESERLTYPKEEFVVCPAYEQAQPKKEEPPPPPLPELPADLQEAGWKARHMATAGIFDLVHPQHGYTANYPLDQAEAAFEEARQLARIKEFGWNPHLTWAAKAEDRRWYAEAPEVQSPELASLAEVGDWIEQHRAEAARPLNQALAEIALLREENRQLQERLASLDAEVDHWVEKAGASDLVDADAAPMADLVVAAVIACRSWDGVPLDEDADEHPERDVETGHGWAMRQLAAALQALQVEGQEAGDAS